MICQIVPLPMTFSYISGSFQLY